MIGFCNAKKEDKFFLSLLYLLSSAILLTTLLNDFEVNKEAIGPVLNI